MICVCYILGSLSKSSLIFIRVSDYLFALV
nr:MAG TPA: hypothetical protein [Caudoviricetes sp.]DAZ42561.1 MAG TPA: hypothetical protein [Caudoviricetes sp.]